MCGTLVGRGARAAGAVLAIAILGAAAAAFTAAAAALPEPFLSEADFPDGVAGAGTAPDRVLLWTRSPGGGLLEAQVSADPGFPAGATATRKVLAREGDGFTARVEVRGLEPGTDYHYRFVRRSDGAVSPPGRLRTPPAGDVPAAFRMALSGDWDPILFDGAPWFGDPAVLGRMRAEGADLAVLLGDMINADSQVGAALGRAPAGDFEGFSALWEEGRSHAALRDLLSSQSTFLHWDDHEVTDNASGLATDPALFRDGRRAFERWTTAPRWRRGLGFYRTVRWGSDVELFFLDERSFRSPQLDDLASDPFPTLPDELRDQVPPEIRAALGMTPGSLAAARESVFDPSRTLLGRTQKRRFLRDLARSTAAVKVVVNEVAMAEQFLAPYDRWEGFAAERAEVLDFIAGNGIGGVVFLTTDFHGVQVRDVRRSALAGTPVVAREFIVGPIAEFTLTEQLASVFGEELTGFFVRFCEQLDPPAYARYDVFSYAVLEYDPATGEATVTIKDDAGAVLHAAPAK